MWSFIVCTLHQILLGYSKQRRMRWVMHIANMEEIKSAYKILDGKLERKMPLGRLRHR